MPLTRERLLAMDIDIKEIVDDIDAGQEKLMFGDKLEDVFVCDTVNQLDKQRILVRNLLEQASNEQYHESSAPGSRWNSVKSTARRFFGYQSVNVSDEIEFAQAIIQRTRRKTRTVSRIRRNHSEIFALAVCGVFLRTYQPEEDTAAVHMWNKRYANASRLSTREKVQESAEKLRILGRRVASIIEFPESSPLSHCVGKSNIGKEMIQRISDLFVRTLELFLDYPRASFVDEVIQRAEKAIDDTLRHFHSPMKAAGSTSTIAEERRKIYSHFTEWEDANGNFNEKLEEAKLLSDSERLILMKENDTILEEVSAWNLLLPSSEGGSITTTTVKQIAAESFTYKNINSKIPRVLGLEVLFYGKPQSKSEDEAHAVHGGFGRVYKIDLPEPFTRDVIVGETNSSDQSITWSISSLAVKVQGLLSDTPAKEYYSSENARCARIVRELRIWSKMKHENILPLFGVWTNFGAQNANYPVPVSPWMEDGDLLSYLKAQKTVTTHGKLVIMRDVASALGYLHGMKYPVVHGDLKSNNILIRNQRAYLTDFGISTILDEVSGQSSTVHVNIRWAAPELIRETTDKPQKPTCESDMYSFGSVVLEALTLDVPWTSKVTPSMLWAIRAKNLGSIPDRPDSISPNSPLWEFMRKCWRPEPLLRPTALQAFAAIFGFMNKGCE